MRPSSAMIVAEARRWIGTPYRHRASLRGVGCDCLGLVRGIWRTFYGPEPETAPLYSPDWAEAAGEETLYAAGLRHLVPVAVEAFAPGDVLMFRWREGAPAKHVGIAASGAALVHAHDGAGVAETPFGIWRPRLAYAFRFPEIRA